MRRRLLVWEIGNRVVTDYLEKAEGILGKESRGNDSVQGETVHRNESETGWVARVPWRGFFLGGCLMSLLFSQTPFILTVKESTYSKISHARLSRGTQSRDSPAGNLR